MTDPKKSVLVIAYGNPQRGDDGVGAHVVRTLRERPVRRGGPPLGFEVVHQLTPELAEKVSRSSGIVFIDAQVDGIPGSVRCESVRPVADRNRISHVLSPATLLLLAERLYGNAPRATLVTIVGTSFDYSEKLSQVTLAAVPEAARIIRCLDEQWTCELMQQ